MCMKVDKNSRDITKKYKKIRSLLKSWCKDKEISWSKIQRYLERESNYKKFIEHNNLEDTHSTKKIIFDTLEDFLISESLEWGSMFEHEKILADYFDVSLSHIKLLEPKLNLFQIDLFGELVKVICLSKEDIIELEEMISQEFFSSLSNLRIDMNVSPNNIELNILPSDTQGDLLSIINSSKLSEKLLEKLRESPKKLIHWKLHFAQLPTTYTIIK
jgi:hypothetical protein